MPRLYLRLLPSVILSASLIELPCMFFNAICHSVKLTFFFDVDFIVINETLYCCSCYFFSFYFAPRLYHVYVTIIPLFFKPIVNLFWNNIIVQSFKSAGLFYPAFPYCLNVSQPSLRKIPTVFCVPLSVGCELVNPELSVCLRNFPAFLAVVLVPETAVDEYARVVSGHNNVGFTRQVLPVQRKT